MQTEEVAAALFITGLGSDFAMPPFAFFFTNFGWNPLCLITSSNFPAETVERMAHTAKKIKAIRKNLDAIVERLLGT